jgi:hypothetical protein
MTAKKAPANTGFDPTVVARFFETMDDFQMRLDRLCQKIEDLGTEIRKELAAGKSTFASHELRIKALEERANARERECHELRESSHDMKNAVSNLNAKGEGVGLAWKFGIGVATLLSVAATFLAATRRF